MAASQPPTPYSAPSVVSFASKTMRSCNPLTPQYDLPSYSKLPFAQPNFIRTSIDVSDIEGTRPQVQGLWFRV